MVKFRSRVLDLVVFTCGGLVMIYEIIGSRILAPYIGSSTYTWTSLIGVILGALSIGYWLGGITADRKPIVSILASVLFLSGGLVGLTIAIKDPLLTAIGSSMLPIEIKAILAALLLFAPASILLGFVTPYAVKLKTRELNRTGQTVGRLYALSTIGSIVGTFAAGFFLIPFVGSTRTLYFIAVSLFILSILLTPFAISRTNIAILLVFIFGIVFNEGFSFYLREKIAFYDFDTEYNRVQIFDTVNAKNGRPIRALRIDPNYFQSSMYLESEELTSDYARFYDLASIYNSGIEQTLIIGGAGYSYPKHFLNRFPDAKIDVVEIDPGMTKLARRFFLLKDNPRLRIFHEDGRTFLNSAPKNAYDAIFIDAFTSMFSIPFQLTTIEAIKEIKRTLRPNGVVIANVGGAIEGTHSRFLWAEIATYKQEFRRVQIFIVNKDKAPDEYQNIVLVATNHLTSNVLNVKQEFSTLLQKELPTNRFKVGKILTDDLAPVEFYNR